MTTVASMNPVYVGMTKPRLIARIMELETEVAAKKKEVQMIAGELFNVRAEKRATPASMEDLDDLRDTLEVVVDKLATRHTALLDRVLTSEGRIVALEQRVFPTPLWTRFRRWIAAKVAV